MRKLYFKLFIAVLPVLILVAIYFINDPSKVLYHYDSYYPTDGIQYVSLNNDYTGTETFINNYPKYHYDSYVFGSSRGQLFHIEQWEKHVPGGTCYQFAASNESLYGVERKMNLIDSKGGNIKNVLFIFDAALLKVTKENDQFPKDPVLSGKSKLSFEINAFKGFFDAGFLPPYLYMLVTHKVRESVWAGALNNSTIHYNVITNDITYPGIDQRIDADTAKFYGKRKAVFDGSRSAVQLYAPKIIKDSQIVLLNSIKKVLDKNKTSYKIVINPMYDQLKIDSTDYITLCGIFGKDNIYDFSGINDITASKYNYYESAHFRVPVANKIMDTIYARPGFIYTSHALF